MSATDDLLQDHVFIRRLQAVIEKCYTLLYENKNVPFGDLVKIADMMEQFVDNLHHGKEENGYFPETESRYSEEVRKFIIEHEFGRRIARRVRIHLEELLQGRDAREPLARCLKTYSVFILDHTSKEDKFFTDIKEKELKKEFERLRHECMRKSGDLLQTLQELESTEWAR
jgi:hemerythrin-like domain-containing protein